MRKKGALFALLLAFTLVAAACGDSGTTTTAAPTTQPPATTEAPPPPTTAPPATAAPTTTATTRPPITDKPAPSICQVSDVGGIDDKSFNQSAWEGAQLAASELGSEVSFLESQDATDFRPNIDAFIDQGCDIVVTVGFLLAPMRQLTTPIRTSPSSTRRRDHSRRGPTTRAPCVATTPTSAV